MLCFFELIWAFFRFHCAFEHICVKLACFFTGLGSLLGHFCGFTVCLNIFESKLRVVTGVGVPFGAFVRAHCVFEHICVKIACFYRLWGPYWGLRGRSRKVQFKSHQYQKDQLAIGPCGVGCRDIQNRLLPPCCISVLGPAGPN